MCIGKVIEQLTRRGRIRPRPPREVIFGNMFKKPFFALVAVLTPENGHYIASTQKHLGEGPRPQPPDTQGIGIITRTLRVCIVPRYNDHTLCASNDIADGVDLRGLVSQVCMPDLRLVSDILHPRWPAALSVPYNWDHRDHMVLGGSRNLLAKRPLASEVDLPSAHIGASQPRPERAGCR